MFNAHSLPVDQSVETLVERIFFDRHLGLSKHCCDIENQHGARRLDFLLLIVQCLFHSTFYWLKNQFKDSVDYKQSAICIADLFEFNVWLLTVRSDKHVHDRHEVFASAKTLMFDVGLFCVKIFKTTKSYILVLFMFAYIIIKKGNVGNRSIILIPV